MQQAKLVAVEVRLYQPLYLRRVFRFACQRDETFFEGQELPELFRLRGDMVHQPSQCFAIVSRPVKGAEHGIDLFAPPLLFLADVRKVGAKVFLDGVKVQRARWLAWPLRLLNRVLREQLLQPVAPFLQLEYLRAQFFDQRM